MSRWSRDPWQEAMDKQRNARILAARETWPKCSLKSDEPVAKPASPAPLSAWRPLKDAPRHKMIVVRWAGSNEEPFAMVIDDRGLTPAQKLYEFAPIADTLEIDRAVQVKIAEAFGALVDGIVIAHSCVESLSDPHVTLGAKLRKDLLWAADRGPRKALEKFATILHGAMGGRIPDEVP